MPSPTGENANHPNIVSYTCDTGARHGAAAVEQLLESNHPNNRMAVVDVAYVFSWILH